MSKDNGLQQPLRRHPEKDAAVYLVNTNALQAEDMAMQLRYFGHTVLVVSEPGHLPALLAQRAPAAVILESEHDDLLQQIARLRQTGERHFPLILISTRGSFDARLTAARSGVDCYFTKPADMAALTDSLGTMVLSRETHPYRVLLLSNDGATAQHHAEVLGETGMEVKMLHEPADVFRVFDEYRPELAVMDIALPSCRGADLTRLIRQNNVYLDVPIVLLSDDGGFAAQLEAIRSGADDFLVKPVNPVHLVSSLSSRAERYRALRGLIMRDSLTGLFNHSAIKEYLMREMASFDRAQAPLALAMIDLDFFKRINDSYGHPVGDQVIRALARLLQQRLRRGDVIGRYGGEEFAAILPGTTANAAVGVLEHIRDTFSRIRHQADECEFTATFSAGVADLDVHRDADALFRAADAALYEAKRKGRNRVEVWK